jgi:hypothetical protein
MYVGISVRTYVYIYIYIYILIYVEYLPGRYGIMLTETLTCGREHFIKNHVSLVLNFDVYISLNKV